MLNDSRRKELNLERANTLIPKLRDILIDGLSELESLGYFPLVATAYRSPETQDALYAQGRWDLDTVNSFREKAGLDPIEEEDNKIVTNAKSGKSYHEKRQAFDLVSIEDGKANWNNTKFYNDANDIFAKSKLFWGHHFKTIDDIPHWEIHLDDAN